MSEISEAIGSFKELTGLTGTWVRCVLHLCDVRRELLAPPSRKTFAYERPSES